MYLKGNKAKIIRVTSSTVLAVAMLKPGDDIDWLFAVEKGKESKTASVEVLVQCIRNSPSPQIQKQALLVMTAIAPLYPVNIDTQSSLYVIGAVTSR